MKTRDNSSTESVHDKFKYNIQSCHTLSIIIDLIISSIIVVIDYCYPTAYGLQILSFSYLNLKL